MRKPCPDGETRQGLAPGLLRRRRARGVVVESISGRCRCSRMSKALRSNRARASARFIDLGTTTLAAQVVDLANGEVLAVETALNPQARHGADVMSRIQHELRHPGELTTMIRRTLGQMLARLAGGRALEEVLIAGNTAMHHLFCGLSVTPLAAVPFLSPELAERHFSAGELGWAAEIRSTVRFLPCLGGFVGSDLLVGIVATRLHELSATHALFDIWAQRRDWCWAGRPRNPVRFPPPAGPAFPRRQNQRGYDRPRRRPSMRCASTMARTSAMCWAGASASARGIVRQRAWWTPAACALELGQILPTCRASPTASKPLCSDGQRCAHAGRHPGAPARQGRHGRGFETNSLSRHRAPSA